MVFVRDVNKRILRDTRHLKGFVTDNQPVLRASCHRSNALAEVGGPGGFLGTRILAAVTYALHGRRKINGSGGLTIVRDRRLRNKKEGP